MKLLHLCVCGILVLSPMAATAAGSMDLRLLGSSYEIEDSDSSDDVETDGDGYELRGRFDFSPLIFGRLQYTKASADEVEVAGIDIDVDLDTETFRGGVGIQGGGTKVRYYGALEYAQINVEVEGDDADDDGFIVAGGIGDAGGSKFLWNVELGLVRFGEVDGGLLAFDLGYRFNPMFAVVFGGQSYGLEDNDDLEYSLTEVSLGLRISFQ